MVGPLNTGQLFDTIGRKPMISLVYIVSGVLLAITALLLLATAGMSIEDLAELFLGVNTQGKSLEDVASPLTCPG